MLVSSFAFGGIPRKAVEKAFLEADIYVSPALLNEYREVPLALEAEKKIDHLQMKALISGIASFAAKANIVYPSKKLTICRDAEDDMVLECCLEAEADILITGDSDLLDLRNLSFELRILTPRKFLDD